MAKIFFSRYFYLEVGECLDLCKEGMLVLFVFAELTSLCCFGIMDDETWC